MCDSCNPGITTAHDALPSRSPLSTLLVSSTRGRPPTHGLLPFIPKKRMCAFLCRQASSPTSTVWFIDLYNNSSGKTTTIPIVGVVAHRLLVATTVTSNLSSLHACMLPPFPQPAFLHKTTKTETRQMIAIIIIICAPRGLTLTWLADFPSVHMM